MSEEKKFIASLDGLRGFACLLVIACHLGYAGFLPVIYGIGGDGVMIFFALSGFLITFHYLPTSQSLRYWISYIFRRIIRIYPPFFISTLFYLAFKYIFSDLKSAAMCWSMRSCPDIYWIIPVEIRFYIIYPFLALLLAYGLRHLNAWTLILIGLPLSIASTMAYPVLGNQNALPLFLCGLLAGLAYKSSTLEKPSKISQFLEKKSNVILIILFVLYIVMILSTGYLIENTFEVFWARSWYLAPFVAGLVFFTAISSKGLAAIFSHPFARWIGRISFSLYLLHKFAIYIVINYFPENFQNLFISLILIFLTATAFYYIIERPFAILAKKVT